MATPEKKKQAKALWESFARKTRARQQAINDYLATQSAASKADLDAYQSGLRSIGINGVLDAGTHGVKWAPSKSLSGLKAISFWDVG